MTLREKYSAMQSDVQPDAALLRQTRAAVRKAPARPRRLRPLIALAAAVICLALTVPAFAMPALAADPSGYALLYSISPAAAQFFKPVNRSDEDNGIRLTVDSVYLHSDTVEVYVALQDLTGDRLDETTDLFDSYRINRGFDCSATCSRVGYDAQTRTARFLISITSFDGQDIEGDKLTFSLGRLLTGKTETEGAVTGLDLAAAQAEPDTQRAALRGFGGSSADVLRSKIDGSYTADMLVPTGTLAAPAPGVTVTAMGYIDGLLHIQVLYENIYQTDNHGQLWLENGAEKLECLGSLSFFAENGSDSFEEYVFDVSPAQLADCTLYGSFVTADTLIEGGWEITFPLTEAG